MVYVHEMTRYLQFTLSSIAVQTCIYLFSLRNLINTLGFSLMAEIAVIE